MAEYENIKLEIKDEVGWITINRPPVNVLNIATMKEIIRALEALKENNDVRVVVITGAGEKAFSAGVDVKDHTPEKVDEMIEVFHEMFKALLEVDKPTIAAVNGVALGGGCELATACDFIVASDKAVFGQPEIKLAVMPTVAFIFLTRFMGRRKALEMILIGDNISAEEALKIGLINRVVPPDKLEEAAMELASKLKANSLAALRIARRTFYQILDKTYDEAIRIIEENYLGPLMSTEDAIEGLTAFLEKRKPTWKHK